jgi:hypothetical protein
MASATKTASRGGLIGLIGPLLSIVTTSLAARGIREAAAAATRRMALTLAAGVVGSIALFCFSNAALTLLEYRMDPAGAWAIIGAFYGIVGGTLYFAATRRRRGA